MTTPGNDELARNIQQIRDDIRSGFARIETRFAETVDKDVYLLEISQLKAKNDELKAQVVEMVKGRTLMWRFIIGTILVPIGMLLLQVYTSSRGF